jgi:hypothetical protein
MPYALIMQIASKSNGKLDVYLDSSTTYIKSMRKSVIAALLISALFASPAHSSPVELPGYATFDYPTSVKLKKTGCQIISVNYKTEESLSREDTVFLIAITPKENKRSVGYAAWFSKLTYRGEQALPAMSRVGALQIKICRQPWKYSSNADKLTPPVKPGNYRIFFVGVICVHFRAPGFIGFFRFRH